MPGKYFDYYRRVADRIVPYLRGRRVTIEQQFPGTRKIVYRRHAPGTDADSWIRINDEKTLIDWARQYAEAFHAHVRAEDDGAWFVIDIDSRKLPTEAARLAAIHAVEVLADQALEPLVKFSGSDGYHVMWDVSDLEGIDEDELWELERAVVRAVACEVERRLESDARAASIRKAVGADRPLITTSSADRENPQALLFDEYILKENANFRVPFSVHPHSGLVAVPLPEERLAAFRPEEANPDRIIKGWPDVPLPRYSLTAVRSAIAAWQADGC
jgi:hypothetical protein